MTDATESLAETITLHLLEDVALMRAHAQRRGHELSSRDALDILLSAVVFMRGAAMEVAAQGGIQ